MFVYESFFSYHPLFESPFEIIINSSNEATSSHQNKSRQENTVLIYSRKWFNNNILGQEKSGIE